ncbi:hypothetical protein JCM8097_000578 [Rhodosporidiobolus ruineniae]
MASSSAAPAQPINLTAAEGFVSGAIAACTAVTITNPMEVAKTRLQLDGELQGRKHIPAAVKVAGAGGAAAGAPVVPEAHVSLKAGPNGRVYTSAVDCMRKTWANEGLGGIQRGLGAAYAYQIALNGSRLGFFEPIRHTLNSAAGYEKTSVHAWTSITAGAMSGVIGAIFGNPLFLVKARMQAYSPFNPVGAQHHYPSALHGLRAIVQSEGVKGLARGVDAAMLRTAMGSSVQLPAYNLAKTTLNGWGVGDHAGLYLLSSTFSGACVLVVMQPADTALTRMYNQSPNSIGPDGKPRGLLYKNPIDCLYKTVMTEGFFGLYKGSIAHLLRIAPHTVVTLVTNEFISRKLAPAPATPANGPAQDRDTLSFPCDSNALQAQLEQWTTVAFDFDSPDFGDHNDLDCKPSSPAEERSTLRYAGAFAHAHNKHQLHLAAEESTISPELASGVDLNALIGSGAGGAAFGADPFAPSSLTTGSLVDPSLSLPSFGAPAQTFPSFFNAGPAANAFVPPTPAPAAAVELPTPAPAPAAPAKKGKKAVAAAAAAAAAEEKEKKKRAPSAKVAAKFATAHKELPLPEGVNTDGMTEEQLNALAIEEDKRRRNTAASARFRVKKKQREQALEQTAKELRDRVAALEKEVDTLRTENGWLRGLIVSKAVDTTGGAGLGGAANNRKRAREDDEHQVIDPSSIFV